MMASESEATTYNVTRERNVPATMRDGTILRADIYRHSDYTPTLGDGADGVFDLVEYKYNRQGQHIKKKHQNGTVRQYTYDGLDADGLVFVFGSFQQPGQRTRRPVPPGSRRDRGSCPGRGRRSGHVG